MFGEDQQEVLYLVTVHTVQGNKLGIILFDLGNFSKAAHYNYRQPVVLL